MGVLAFILLFVVVGVVIWLAVAYVPMPAQFKAALPVIGLVLLVLILLFIVFNGLGGHDIQIPHVR